MAKRVLEVGNCDPDHSSIKRLLEQSFAAEVVRTHNLAEALVELGRARFDLVLVNRLMDKDGSPGIDIIKAVKGDAGAHEAVEVRGVDVRVAKGVDGVPALLVSADPEDVGATGFGSQG